MHSSINDIIHKFLTTARIPLMLELQAHQGYLTSMLDEDGTTVLLAACLGCYLSRLSSCYQAQSVEQKGYSILANW